MNKIVVVFFFIITVFAACDVDTYTGYKYEADSLIRSTRIYGNVRNVFSGAAVRYAQVAIGQQYASADWNGYYSIDYRLASDEERNKQIAVYVTADKYIPYSSFIYVYPQDTELNIALEYGAPIIQATALVDTRCQAIIFDYQGVDDISRVTARTYYRYFPQERGRSFPFTLELVRTASANTGYFEGKVDSHVVGIGYLYNKYTIIAEDKLGIIDSLQTYSWPDDTLLF